jgi:hypothetical protein
MLGAIDAPQTDVGAPPMDGGAPPMDVDASAEEHPDASVDSPSPIEDTSPEGASSDTTVERLFDAPSDRDEAGTCDPLASPLPNEGLHPAPGTGGCPDGMTRVDTFCIDRYEASLEVVAPDGGRASWSPFVNPGNNVVSALSIAGATPQAYIDQVQASEACATAGKRLCTNAEWLRACRGSTGLTYPYGDVRMPGVCNDARAVHPAIEYAATIDATFAEVLRNACIDQLPNTLEPAGSRSGCVTEDGAYDMMGNLHEWTADPAGTFRGGYFVDTVLNGDGCLYTTTAHDTLYWDYSTGFRCCADP